MDDPPSKLVGRFVEHGSVEGSLRIGYGELKLGVVTGTTSQPVGLACSNVNQRHRLRLVSCALFLSYRARPGAAIVSINSVFS